jgi:large subunit ribosomal protein L13
MIIIDGTNKILGRLASLAAKLALNGEEVVIINSEKVLVSGSSKANVEEFFKVKRERGDPYHGPFYPRYPDQIVKRVIRGMLPYKIDRGRKALKRIKAYIGVPKEIEVKEEFLFKDIKELSNLNKKSVYVELGEIAKKMGARW